MSLQWFESDGVTPLGSINLGQVGPGETYVGKHGVPKLVVLKNTGAGEVTDTAIEIMAVSTFPANQFVRLATGAVTPDAGAFVGAGDPDLQLGSLAAGESVNVWLDMIVPLAASRGLGQLVNLRAYGAEA